MNPARTVRRGRVRVFTGGNSAGQLYPDSGEICNFRNTVNAVRVIKGFLKLSVRNATRGTVLGDAIEVADDSAGRAIGLLKHKSLEPGHGLWIVPCEGIHTFFMKFAIDVVYIDRKRRVRKTVRALAPWRLSLCLTAHSVLELPAGVIEATGTRKGDQLEW